MTFTLALIFNYSFNPCSDLLIQSNICRHLAFYPGYLPTLNYPQNHLELSLGTKMYIIRRSTITYTHTMHRLSRVYTEPPRSKYKVI